MAQVFRLANDSQDVTYSFLTGNLKPADMIRTPNGDGWYTTTMTLVARTTDANIISAVNTIDELAEANALFWEDQHRAESIWLEESATSETAKRSLIQSMELTPLQVGWFSTMLNKTGALYSLTIIHSAAWEKTSSALSTNTNIGCLGGMITLAAIDGSLPGRISLLNIAGDTDNGGHLTTFWCGIRPVQSGDTDFSPILELETGTLVAPCVVGSDSDEASPKGTTDNIISYASTTDDVKIDYMTMDNALTSTNYHHWIGNYVVLLRARLDTAQTVRLHVDSGYLGGTVFNQGPYVYTSSTDYTLLEMGQVSMPPFPHAISADYLEKYEFQLYCLRIGTATTLIADCLILIPATHYAKIENAIVEDSTSSHLYARIYEDGLISAINYDLDGKINIAGQYKPSNFVYPIEGGIFVIAGQRSTIHDMDDAVGVNISSIERFRTHGE